jgi:hypothetical protein
MSWTGCMSGFRGGSRGLSPRARVRRYVPGLVAGLERKNGWTLAEQAGAAAPGGLGGGGSAVTCAVMPSSTWVIPAGC